MITGAIPRVPAPRLPRDRVLHPMAASLSSPRPRAASTGQRRHTAVLIASGDLREEANRVCWPAQKAMEADLTTAFGRAGWSLVRGHAASRSRGHGFIASAREGLGVFETIDPTAPLVVAARPCMARPTVSPGPSRRRSVAMGTSCFLVTLWPD